ncbi:Type 1 phosphatases regulator ypi1 [Coemansia sp. 'formosensis']|uniref:Type 1 phosphatases regulator ypi1 n=1 Tax=Coemansia furcata TaxID=417177 RepID=A0ACC1L4J3_9FUNG|nr:Type 1 phosphatases regulator ypi1 [Coemansia furcata]KAJ2819617.1 Type 1 phosphatases regulator ypi1 [Coemansia sp. 'formosensis']
MVVSGNEESGASPATSVPAEGMLRLRGESSRHPSTEEQLATPAPTPTVAGGPRVQWAEDTVDNEHMNRKKSKVCCIFRRQRQFDESDSDESCGSHGSSNDDDDGDSDSPNEYERMPKVRGKKHKHQCKAVSK